MNLKYVLNSMRRHKLRTFIIALALTIGVALVGALLALVDTQRQFSLQTVGAETGGYDLSISKSDLAASPFFNIMEVEALAGAAYDQIAAMHPRLQANAEGRAVSATEGQAVTFIAIEPITDHLLSPMPTGESESGAITLGGIRIASSNASPRSIPGGGGGAPPDGVPRGSPRGIPGGVPGGGPGDTPPGESRGGRSTTNFSTMPFAGVEQNGGAFPPAPGQVFLSNSTAAALSAQTGDQILLSYAIPTQREAGQAVITGTSTPRITAVFTVCGVGELSGVSSDIEHPVIMRLDDAQT